MIQTCWPYKGKLSKTLSNLWGIQPQKSEDQSSWLKRFVDALFSMEGVVVGCHTVIIQQSIMAMRLSIGCLWQALRNGTRLKQTSHTLPISSLVPERGMLLQIHLFNQFLTFLYFEKDTFCSSLESCSTKLRRHKSDLSISMYCSSW